MKKRILSLLLALALLGTLLTGALAADTDDVTTLLTADTHMERTWGTLLSVKDNKLTYSDRDGKTQTVTLAQSTFLVDSMTGAGLDASDLMVNQAIYLYLRPDYRFKPVARCVIANVPADARALQFVQIAGITVIDKAETVTTPEGEVVTAPPAIAIATPEGEEYRITANTTLSRFVRKGDMAILSIPTVEELEVGKGLLLQLDDQNNVTAARITSAFASDPVAGIEKITANGKAVTLAPYQANGEQYLPLRQVAEAFDIQVGWRKNPNAATVLFEGDMILVLPIGLEHRNIGGHTYVSQTLIEAVLGLTVTATADGLQVTK